MVKYKNNLFKSFSLIENNNDILISSTVINKEKTNSNSVSFMQEFMSVDVMKNLMLKDVEPSSRKLKVMEEEEMSYWKIILNKAFGKDSNEK